MAAGNHLENGIWALFVIAAIIKVKHKIGEYEECQKLIILHCEAFRAHPIDKRINTSPIRFVSAVIIPAASDFGFW